MRVHDRWRTRALLGFGLAGLALNSGLLWLAYKVMSADTYVAARGWQRVVAWRQYAYGSGLPGTNTPLLRTFAPLARDPISTLFASFTVAAVVGIAYATLRERYDPHPEDESAGFRPYRAAIQLVGWVLPWLPIAGLVLLVYRALR